MESKITILVLCYGDHLDLAKRCLSSIINNFDKNQYYLKVGLNKVSNETRDYVLSLNEVDDIYISKTNIHKPAMWRRMSKDIPTKWCMWFDDDSYVLEKNALENRLNLINTQDFDMCGHIFFLNGEYEHFKKYIRQQNWYNQKPIPCGVTSYENIFNTDGLEKRWFFLTGGNWLIKSELLEKFNYPPLNMGKYLIENNHIVNQGDDILICEILRQNNCKLLNIGEMGIRINDSARRGLSDIIDSKEYIYGDLNESHIQ